MGLQLDRPSFKGSVCHVTSRLLFNLFRSHFFHMGTVTASTVTILLLREHWFCSSFLEPCSSQETGTFPNSWEKVGNSKPNTLVSLLLNNCLTSKRVYDSMWPKKHEVSRKHRKVFFPLKKGHRTGTIPFYVWMFLPACESENFDRLLGITKWSA